MRIVKQQLNLITTSLRKAVSGDVYSFRRINTHKFTNLYSMCHSILRWIYVLHSFLMHLNLIQPIFRALQTRAPTNPPHTYTQRHTLRQEYEHFQCESIKASCEQCSMFMRYIIQSVERSDFESCLKLQLPTYPHSFYDSTSFSVCLLLGNSLRDFELIKDLCNINGCFVAFKLYV